MSKPKENSTGRVRAFARRACAVATIVFGVDLIVCVLIFPPVKAWADHLLVGAPIEPGTTSSVLMMGYGAVAAAVAVLLLLPRIPWTSRVTEAIGSVSRRRFVLGVALLALTLRLAGLAIYQMPPVSDSVMHEEKAWNVSQGLGYITQRKGPDAHWPPGYIFFAGSVYWFFGRSWVKLAIANAVLDSFTTVLVYFLARRFANEVGARAAGGLYALNPLMIVACQAVIYAPLLALLIVAIALSAGRRPIRQGLLLGVGSIVKPILLPGALLVAYTDAASGMPLARVVRRAAIVVVTMAVCIAPWTWRNYLRFDRFLLVSANNGTVLRWGNNPDTVGRMMSGDGELYDARGAEIIDIDRRARDEAWAWIRDNPVRFLVLLPVKQAHTWGTELASIGVLDRRGKRFEFLTRVIVQVFYVGLALAAGAGLVRYARMLVEIPEGVMVSLLLLMVWAIHSIYIGWSFYHEPMLPLLSVMAVAGWGESDRVDAEREARTSNNGRRRR